MGASGADQKSKKGCHFEVSYTLNIGNNNKPISWSDFDLRQKVGFYTTTSNEWPAQQLDWEEAPKLFLKPKLHQKQFTVTGGLLPIWSTTGF